MIQDEQKLAFAKEGLQFKWGYN